MEVPSKMLIDPRYTTIGKIFSDQYVFKVPKYQRNYVWDTSELEDFLEDIYNCYNKRICDNICTHFFGGIVCVKITVTGSSRSESELVDGQQRISTFVIMASCLIKLYDELLESIDPSSEEILDIIRKRSKKLRDTYIVYEDMVNLRPDIIDRIVLSSPDDSFFKDKLNGLDPEPRRESHRHLQTAFQLIYLKVKSTIEEKPNINEKIVVLHNFELILMNDCRIMLLETDSKQEAYRLFQVLNNRGTSLTEGDLLRARTLELLEGYDDFQRTVENSWDDILKDNAKKVDDYLKWFYSSLLGKRPGSSSLFDDFVDDLIKGKSPNDIVNLIGLLKSSFQTFRKLSNGDWPFETITPQITAWDKDRLRLLIVALEHTHCMPLLLSATRLSQVKFSIIVNYIERFFFRNKIICNLHANSLTKVYLEHAKKIRNNPEGYKIDELLEALHALQDRTSDETFKANLSSLKYQKRNSNKPLKYLLMTIEHYLVWYESGANGQPTCRDKSVIYDFGNTNIEHIYPLNADPRDQQLEELVNIIGNLTFMNSNINELLGNGDFVSKKDALSRSSIKMNRDIAQNDIWDSTKVTERTERLTDIAIKIFRI
jgi:uncharacterized protein with ParB-like and HNH nuclease domain